MTGIGVRAQPVCVDGVDTAQFDVLAQASGDVITDAAQAAAATVSAGCTIPVEWAVLDSSHPLILQTLIDLITEEKCAPYYITSTESKSSCGTHGGRALRGAVHLSIPDTFGADPSVLIRGVSLCQR